MATCLKTGIDVHLEEYAAVVRADLHEAPGALIINFNPDSWTTVYGDHSSPHEYCEVRVGSGYLHRDKGILVNPSEFRRVKK